MAVTTSTTITETIHTEAIGAAALYFESNPGITGFCTVANITGQDTNTFVFPILDQVTAEAIAENSDFTTTSTIDSSGSPSATVTEHAIRSDITDYSADSSTVNMAASQGATVGQMHAIAMRKREDQDVTALFASFNSSTGSNTGPLTSTLLSDAVNLLNVNNIPEGQRVTAIHPTQFGPLIPVFDDASTFGRQGQELLNTGGIGLLYGTTVFQTTNIATATVSASTVYAGAVMHATAVGVVEKGGPMFEVERNASLRAAEVILVKKWGEVEYRGGATTSGRGGAGVYFYSNTTN